MSARVYQASSSNGRYTTNRSYKATPAKKEPLTQRDTPTRPEKVDTKPSIDHLPIAKHLDDIVKSIRTHQATILKLATSSGKTIGGPNALYHAGLKTLVALPLRAATIAAESYQRKLLDDPDRKIVGYACEGEKFYDDSHRIVYATTGHVMNLLLKSELNFDVLILDEFHVRTVQSDISFALWKNSFASNVKLLIASATLDDEITALVSDLDVNVLDYQVSTRPIEDVYVSCDDPYAEAVTQAVNNLREDGCILIFAPGKFELETIEVAIVAKLPHAKVLCAHSEMEIADQLEILNEYPNKIVVATNIAEFSITIPKVHVVIDTMTHRVMYRGDASMLSLEKITKSNSKQRRGRTGRTCNGKYIALMDEDEFVNLRENVIPEITRSSITAEILKIVNADLNPVKLLSAIVSPTIIQTQIDELVACRCLIPKTTGGFMVTSMGKFCSRMPLSVGYSCIVYMFTKHGINQQGDNLFLATFVVCALSTISGPMWLKPKRRRDENRTEWQMRINDVSEAFKDKFGGYSDVDTLGNVCAAIIATGCFSLSSDHRSATQSSDRNRLYIDKKILWKFVRENDVGKFVRDCIAIFTQCVGILNYKVKNIYSSDVEYKWTKDVSKIFYDVLTVTHANLVVKMIDDSVIMRSNSGCELRYSLDRSCINKALWVSSNACILQRREQKTAKGKVIGLITMWHTIESDRIVDL